MLSRPHSRVTAGVAAALIAAAVTGCAQSTTDAQEPTPAPLTSVNSVAPQATFTIASGSKASGPDLVEVHRGDTVTLDITSDKVEPLHVHGYDKLVELQPGPNQVQFVADLPGTFEVELHSSDSLLTRLRVDE